MISPERYARERSSYWNERLPQLERFVRAANLSVERFAVPIASEIDKDRRAFIAELAFEMLRFELASGGTKSPDLLGAVEPDVRARIAVLSGQGVEEVPDTSPNERAEIEKLLKSLRQFVKDRHPRSIEISPRFPGCGVIDDGAGDMILERDVLGPEDPFGTRRESIERILIEVKMVGRSFRAADFRQLIVYAALMTAAEWPPSSVALVNPRRGTYFESSTDHLAMDTAGLPADELLTQIIYDVSAADVSP